MGDDLVPKEELLRSETPLVRAVMSGMYDDIVERMYLDAMTIREKDEHGRWTHCKVGHRYTPENTYTNPTTGKRECLTCKRRKERRWKEENKWKRHEPD
jgi:hypothetical protein